jgi:ribosomal protein S18 acetylase RimI-like enzyme
MTTGEDQSGGAWRPMREHDLAKVVAVADLVHPNHPEDPEVFAERLALHPEGCLVHEESGDLTGYVVSHPWIVLPPSLNTRIGSLPPAPSTYYIHDLALLPLARGQGAAGAVVRRLLIHAAALGLPCVSLVAVEGSAAFWTRCGFREEEDPALAGTLRSYGLARFMVRPAARNC